MLENYNLVINICVEEVMSKLYTKHEMNNKINDIDDFNDWHYYVGVLIEIRRKTVSV